MDDKALKCLQRIRRKRFEKLRRRKKFLYQLFPNDHEYNLPTLKNDEELLILDIFGFSKKELQEKRLDIFQQKQLKKEKRYEYLATPMWQVFSAYKKFISEKTKIDFRLQWIKLLHKLGILQLKCTVHFFDEATQKQNSRIELMSVEDFLSFYSPRRVEKIIENVSDEKWSKESKRKALQQFRHFLSFIHGKLEQKIRYGNVKKGLQIVKRRLTNRFMAASEVAALFEEIEKSNNVRDLILCRLIFNCGEQVSYKELQKFQKSQFDAKQKIIFFEQGAEKVTINLSDDTAALLKSHIDRKKKYVLQTQNGLPVHRNHLDRFLQKHALKAGLEPVSIETLQNSIFSIKETFLYL